MRCRSYGLAVLMLGVALVVPRVEAQVPAPSPGACAGPVTQKACVFGFSKDMCGARLSGGVWNVASCSAFPGAHDCRTLQGQAIDFSGALTSNPGLCSGVPCTGLGGRCDETPKLVGDLVASVDLNAQQGGCCPGRGSWGGEWKLIDNTPLPPNPPVTLASGRLDGTLGVGTHRPSCNGSCGPNCESCYEAKFDAATQTWSVHSEGFLQGYVGAGGYAGCWLRASFQGRFSTNGDASGPAQPQASWRFCGNVDGVVECPCI